MKSSRRIFTAAHELGHLLLHPSVYRRDATELPMRAEVDQFASEFLMSEEAFQGQGSGCLNRREG